MGALNALGKSIVTQFDNSAPKALHSLTTDTADHAMKAMGDVSDLWDRAFTSGREFMRKMGLEPVVTAMDEVDTQAKLRAGKSFAQVYRVLEPFRDGNKFRKEDMAHVVDLIENPGEVPKSSAHAAAAEGLSQIFDEYGIDAEQMKLPMIAGARFAAAQKAFEARGLTPEKATAAAMRLPGVVKPFARRENYFPHYFDEATINSFLMPGSKRETKLQEILSRGLASSRDEAGAVLERMLRAPGEFRGGALQHSRELLNFDEYDKDVVEVMKRYLFASARRLEVARKFGNDDALAMKAIDELAGEREGWRRSARNLYSAWAGTHDPRYADLARFTSTFHAITMLSTAGIIQPAQMLNTTAMIGWGNTLRGIAEVAKDWRKAKLMATDMGAIFDGAHRDFSPDSFKSLSELWSKIIGLDGLDRINRVASSIGGRFWAAEQAKQMAAGNAKPWVVELFKQAGIDPADVAGGVLSEEQLRRAGLFISNKSQFGSGVLDLPEFRNTPAGRFAYLFKSFSLQQTQFIKDQIIEPAMEYKDYRPLMRWMTTSTVAAPVIAEAVRVIKNREAPEDARLRAAENLAIVGGFGMFFDAFRAMANGPQSIANWVMGPTASETFQVLGADLPPIWQNAMAGEDPDFGPAVRHVASRVPMAGQWLKQAMLDE